MTEQEFDFSLDLMRAIIWRFDAAPSLRQIAQAKQNWVNTNFTEFWENWFTNVFNPATMDEFGCAVWGRLLDIQMTVSVDLVELTLPQKRLMIQLRYFQLTTRGTVPEVNEFMQLLFGYQGRAFVWDHQDMSITFVLEQAPDPSFKFILDKYDLLPRDQGVKTKWHTIVKPSFGFGPHHLNFNNGQFGNQQDA